MSKLYFIVNTNAKTGNANQAWRQVYDFLRQKHIPYEAYETKYVGHAMVLARELSKKQEKAVYLIAVGGDGTVNEVLNGITDFQKVRLGVIASGSGNDFGKGMGIPTDPIVCMRQILKCIRRENHGIPIKKTDLGQVTWENGKKHRIFGISAGVGLDAIVCKKALHSNCKKFLNRIHLGKLTYLVLTVQSLFTMDTAEAVVECGDNHKIYRLHKTIFAVAMNLQAEGGGIPMAPHASCTDGMLSLSSAHGIPKAITFFCLPFLVAAKHEKIRGFTTIESPVIRVHTSKPVVLHADGEYCGDVRNVEFTCLSEKLQLLK